ncbi:MAG: DUF2804 domain-containing protein [Spirochaetes bacterium]|nr:MAG: DUF2804 domain-containing protein [Spirochaetota bacterium]
MKIMRMTLCGLVSAFMLSCSGDAGMLTDQHGKKIAPIDPPGTERMIQREYTAAVPLLDAKGALAAAGWSRRPLFAFDRTRVAAEAERVKIWEHYTFYTDDYAGAVTVSDIGTLGFGSMELLDLKSGKVIVSLIDIVRPGEIVFPADASRDLHFKKGKSFVDFEKKAGTRRLAFRFDNADPDRDVTCELLLKEASPEALAIVTPFNDPALFFYEYKMPSLSVKGSLAYGGKVYDFPAGKSFAVLDWGRGAWPRDNRWLWAAGACYVNGELMSVNLGYGFGEKAPATENGIVYRGRVHKLDKVRWNYDVANYRAPWSFTANDGRLEMKFTPEFLLHSDLKLGEMLGFLSQLWSNFSIGEIMHLLSTKAYLNKVFGHYTGFLVLDDGTKIAIEKMPGFAEQMYQVW